MNFAGDFTAALICSKLTELIRLEKERTKSRLWTPVSTIKDFLASMSDDVEDYTEEDPDYVKGMQIDPSDLGEASRRNPDYLPPSNTFEIAVSFIYDAFAGMKGGNVTFGIKAGVLSGQYGFKLVLSQLIPWVSVIGFTGILSFNSPVFI